MLSSNIPPKFPIPFANNAGASYIRSIPQAHQTASSSDAPASLYDGFPPETFAPETSGGIPPNGKDFNGILNQVSAWARWQAAGGLPLFDADFCTAIGGYPKYAQLASVTPGIVWQSAVENNTTNPDGGSPSGWIAVADGKFDQDGMVLSTITAPNTYSVTFPTPFPTACTSVSLTGINTTASDLRDNWPQLKTWDRFGFTYVVQTSLTAGDVSLDGISWRSRGN